MSRRKLFYRASGVDTDSFIMTVKTDNAGTSSSTQFTIPTTGAGYNYTVKTSDGQTIAGQTGNCTITFPSAGTYDVKITGLFPRIYFNNGGDRLKLLEVKQWGTIVWNTFNSAFWGCVNAIFTNINDVPIIAITFNRDVMSNSFINCQSLTTINRLNEWDLSQNTSLSQSFLACTNFNQNISNWNTSNVTSYASLFNGCTNFNQNLSSWNVSKGINFSSMFLNCVNFNNGGNSDINNWIFTTSSNINFSSFFQGCSNFNQPVGGWNTLRVTNMSFVFQGCTNFNQNLSNWNLQNNTSCLAMFSGAISFNNGGNDGIKDWNVANVTNMNAMFTGNNHSFNQPLDNWNVSKVTTFGSADPNGIFAGTNHSFNQNLQNWRPILATQFIGFKNNATTTNFSTTNLDAIYNGWTNGQLQPNCSIGFSIAKHTLAGAEGRALLTRTNTTKTITNAVNNGSGLIRISATAHGLSTGNKCFISGVVGTTEANAAWIVTVIDANTIDLQGSTFTNAYTSGGTLRTGYGWTITDGGI